MARNIFQMGPGPWPSVRVGSQSCEACSTSTALASTDTAAPAGLGSSAGVDAVSMTAVHDCAYSCGGSANSIGSWWALKNSRNDVVGDPLAADVHVGDGVAVEEDRDGLGEPAAPVVARHRGAVGVEPDDVGQTVLRATGSPLKNRLRRNTGCAVRNSDTVRANSISSVSALAQSIHDSSLSWQ